MFWMSRTPSREKFRRKPKLNENVNRMSSVKKDFFEWLSGLPLARDPQHYLLCMEAISKSLMAEKACTREVWTFSRSDEFRSVHNKAVLGRMTRDIEQPLRKLFEETGDLFIRFLDGRQVKATIQQKAHGHDIRPASTVLELQRSITFEDAVVRVLRDNRGEMTVDQISDALMEEYLGSFGITTPRGIIEQRLDRLCTDSERMRNTYGTSVVFSLNGTKQKTYGLENPNVFKELNSRTSISLEEAVLRVLENSRREMTADEMSAALRVEELGFFGDAPPSSVIEHCLDRMCTDSERMRETRGFYVAFSASVTGKKAYCLQPYTDEKGKSDLSLTIRDAAIEVLRREGKGLKIPEIYEKIVACRLYNFGAQDPQSVLRIEIDRACIGSEYRTRLPVSHFRSERNANGEKVYFLLPEPVPVIGVGREREISEDIENVVILQTTDLADNGGTSSGRVTFIEEPWMPLTDEGLRDAITWVLRHASRPMTSVEIRDKILDGCHYDGNEIGKEKVEAVLRDPQFLKSNSGEYLVEMKYHNGVVTFRLGRSSVYTDFDTSGVDVSGSKATYEDIAGTGTLYGSKELDEVTRTPMSSGKKSSAESANLPFTMAKSLGEPLESGSQASGRSGSFDLVWNEKVKEEFRLWLESEGYRAETVDIYCGTITMALSNYDQFLELASRNSRDHLSVTQAFIGLLRRERSRSGLSNQVIAALSAMEDFYLRRAGKVVEWRADEPSQVGEEEYSHIVDFCEGKQGLEDILAAHFSLLNGYSNRGLLWRAAQNSLSMFLNDNGFNTEIDLWQFATKVFASRYFFRSPHIWQNKPDHPKSALGQIISMARRNGGKISRQEIDDFLAKAILPSLDNSKILEGRYFLFIDRGEFVLAEVVNRTRDLRSAIEGELKLLFELEQQPFIVLRDIRQSWFSRLPSLPHGHCWTPLLLQELLSTFPRSAYRVISAGLQGQRLDTLGAAIVPADSGIRTFGDVVYMYVMDHYELPHRMKTEELRIRLRDAGMLSSNELSNSLHKALLEHRFAFSSDNQMVKILER